MDDYDDIQKIADSMPENVSLDHIQSIRWQPRLADDAKISNTDISAPYEIPTEIVTSIEIVNNFAPIMEKRARLARARRRPAQKPRPKREPAQTPESISGIGKRRLEL